MINWLNIPEIFEDFLRLAAPPTRLTRNGIRFTSTERREEAFEELKKRLTTVPVLTIPNLGLGYTIYCNASILGIGYVLMLLDKVVAFRSRKLKDHEKNYHTQDLELAAVVLALK